eukprot:scaffold879_cov410-Prasinococcus_capsulatus_cf.AAC.34
MQLLAGVHALDRRSIPIHLLVCHCGLQLEESAGEVSGYLGEVYKVHGLPLEQLRQVQEGARGSGERVPTIGCGFATGQVSLPLTLCRYRSPYVM